MSRILVSSGNGATHRLALFLSLPNTWKVQVSVSLSRKLENNSLITGGCKQRVNYSMLFLFMLKYIYF